MSLCESIDTLSMAYLDDELATEERRELELHITECTACRAHVDAERADHGLIARALAAPAAPDLLRARIDHALDGEDAAAVRAERKRWRQWVLPGSAIAAAAAAIAVFVGVKPAGPHAVGAVAREAVRQAVRPMPLEVQGPATNDWVLHNAAGIEGPRCASSNIQELGARMTAVNGHDAAMYAYRVDTGRDSFVLTAIVMKSVGDDELDGNDEMRVGRHVLHVIHDDQGRTGVTFVDENHRGYMFFAPSISSDDLLSLVASCIGP
jgi:anti-sigma factor RsiW